MKPIKLKMEGFLSYKKPSEIDFSSLGLFAITGLTGAGKTSIVDAIAYALYGQTPRFGLNFKNLISKLSEKLFVEFTFYMNGHYYTVQRSASEKSQKVVLLKDDKKVFDKDKNTLVNEEIKKILNNIDYNTFTKVILLPQGEFAKFIKPDDPSDRRELIMKLTGLDKIENIRNKASEKSKNIEAQINSMQSTLSTLEIQDNLEELELELSKANDELSRLKDELNILQTRHQKASKKKELQEDISNKSKKLQELLLKENEMNNLKSKIDYLEQYVSLISDLERHEELSKKIKDISDKLSLKKQDYTLKEKEYENFCKIFEDIKQKNNDLINKKERLDKGKKIMSKLNEAIMIEKDIKDLKTKLENKKTDLTTLQEKLDKISSDINTLTQLVGLVNIEDIIKKQQQKTKELGELNAISNELDKTKSERFELLKYIETKTKELSYKNQELDNLNQELNKEKDNIIYQYSNIIKSFLKDEDVCPVCGGIYHEKEHIENISSTYDKLLEKVNKLKEDISKIEHDINLRDTQLKDIEDKIKNYEDKLKDKNLLENELKIIEQIQNKLKQKDNLEKDIENTKNYINELQNLIDVKMDTLLKAENELISLELQEKHLQNKENTYKASEKIIKDLEEYIQTTEREFEQAKDRFNKYDKDLELLRKDIYNLEENLRSTEEEFNILSQKLKNIDNEAKILEGLKQLNTYKKEYQEYQLNMKKLKEEINLKQEEFNNIDEREPLEKIEMLISDITDKKELLNQKIGSLSTKISNIRENQEKIKEIKETLKELETKRDIYIQISKDLQKNMLQEYISKKIIENLLKYANYYAEMMGFSYTFLLEEKDNKSDILVENVFGKRSIKSLSGGETFISSLCFALALGEAIGVSSLRSLFIDEGFGTLDKETLNKVGDAIERLSQKTDKVIGIITHVPDLAEKCPSRLIVTKNSEGSSVEVYTQE